MRVIAVCRIRPHLLLFLLWLGEASVIVGDGCWLALAEGFLQQLRLVAGEGTGAQAKAARRLWCAFRGPARRVTISRHLVDGVSSRLKVLPIFLRIYVKRIPRR